MPPKFLYFDVGNVLLKFSNQLLCRQLGELLAAPADAVWDFIFVSKLHLEYEAGRIDSAEFYDRVTRHFGSRPDFAAFAHAGSDIFQINAPIKPIISYLAQAGYPLGLLSNTNQMHWDFYTDGRYKLIPELFSVHALSFRLHALKPHADIYLRAAELAGHPPHEIFFVDDIAENVAGARAVGFDAVLFTSPSQLAADLHTRGLRFNY